MVPVLIRFHFKHLKSNPPAEIMKLIVSPSMKILQLQQVIRNRVKLEPSFALFLFCGREVQCGRNQINKSENEIKRALDRHKNALGILEIVCTDFPSFWLIRNS